MMNQLFEWFGKPIELNNYISFHIGSRMVVPKLNKYFVWKSEGKIIYSNTFFHDAYNTHQILTYTNFHKAFGRNEKKVSNTSFRKISNF